ncbi:MAG TPA: hypothetical protein VKB50_28805 [Vicinamibacterales bacterium]|nr:hypothetical protein [Vicinamibacterales bacterium]
MKMLVWLTIRRALVLSAIAWLLAAGIRVSIPVLFGAPLPRIGIVWRIQDAGERAALEQQFRLSEPERIDDRKWMYVPLDRSPAVLLPIIESTAIESTDGIDRGAATISSTGPLTERRGGIFPGIRLAPVAKAAAYLFTGLGTLLLVAALIKLDFARARDRVNRSRPGLRSLASLQRGIPAVTADAAGIFRVALVTVLLLIVRRDLYGIGDLPDISQAGSLHGVQAVVVALVLKFPVLLRALAPVLLLAGILTILGMRTRLSFAVFVAAFIVWGCLSTIESSHHPVVALELLTIGLLAAPWGDAWSVDALVRRVRGRAGPGGASRRYGYVVWLPGFVLGLCFAAAAYSKIRSGPAWILNGTVRYHFVTDAANALVSWGPALTRHHGLAVVLSAAAVFVEAAVIAGSFTRSYRVRLALGGAAMMLLAGFALFQGVFWPGWWVLLLSFLPWHRIQTSSAPSALPASLPAAQVALIVALVIQQALISLVKTEVPPLASSFDMYSTTYASEVAYEQATNLVYQVVVKESGADREVPECQVDDRTALGLREDSRQRDKTSELRRLLQECHVDPLAVSEVTLRGDRRVYDWNAASFAWRRAIDVIGPLSTSAARQ